MARTSSIDTSIDPNNEAISNISNNETVINKDIIRCNWVTTDPIYLAYHDNEWGKAEKDNHKLFEMLCLEGQQAGLSWITVLKKRENYRQCFFQFDPEKIALMTDDDVDILMQNTGIIRHRGKINAIIANAKAYLEMRDQGQDFSHFIWQFVDNKPIINHWQEIKSVPAMTELSISLSKILKKKGFKFCGPTICYSFMQAVGLIDDHIEYCICRKQNK